MLKPKTNQLLGANHSLSGKECKFPLFPCCFSANTSTDVLLIKNNQDSPVPYSRLLLHSTILPSLLPDPWGQ